MPSTIQNETLLRKVQIGKETTIGTAVTPTAKMGGVLNVTQDRPLVDKPARDGTYGVARNPKFGNRTFGGTYEDELSFEDWAILLQYGVAVAPAGVSDGQTTPRYLYDYKPGQGLISSFSAEEGVDGLLKKSAGLQFNDFTISMDIDDSDGNWKFSGNLLPVSHSLTLPVVAATNATGGSVSTVVKTGAAWTINAYQGGYVKMLTGTTGNIGEIRQIASNDATTLTLATPFPSAVANADTFEIFPLFTSLSGRDVDYIQNEGTQIIIGSNVAALATASNEIKDKLIKFSVTYDNQFVLKKFANNVGVYSAKRGRKKRMISGVFTMEFDDPGQKRIWEQTNPPGQALRFQQILGPQVNASPATYKTATITVPKFYYDKIDDSGDRNGNMTADYQWKAYADVSAGYDISYAVNNQLATLPA